uniref:Uncharacterized protein n=1 Tax=Oryza sativa subsp. japonica TaxID=39947 RepID=Q2QX44_ORYSJ|nr:hypothetical protein LOC_Os12g07240 [Oryza sativa Japonica Group]
MPRRLATAAPPFPPSVRGFGYVLPVGGRTTNLTTEQKFFQPHHQKSYVFSGGHRTCTHIHGDIASPATYSPGFERELALGIHTDWVSRWCDVQTSDHNYVQKGWCHRSLVE